VKHAGEITKDTFPRDALHGFGRPVDGNSQRIVLPEHFLEEDVHVFIRGILDHSDFLHNDLLLAGNFLGGKDRVEEDIGEDIDHQRQMGVQDLGMEADILLRGERVGETAHGIKFAGNILSAPLLRTLEQHVLNEMGDPAFFGFFIP